MDAADVFRQGLRSVTPRYNQQTKRPPSSRDDVSESDGSSHRIAHTLTACCRCRQVSPRFPRLLAAGCRSPYQFSNMIPNLPEEDAMRSNLTPLPAL
jgi:hypothetical protein